MTLQERLNELKQLDPRKLAAKLPPDCRGHKPAMRATFVPGLPPRFPRHCVVTPGMRDGFHTNYPSNYDGKMTVREYIQQFDLLNGLKPVEYILVNWQPEPLQIAA